MRALLILLRSSKVALAQRSCMPNSWKRLRMIAGARGSAASPDVCVSPASIPVSAPTRPPDRRLTDPRIDLASARSRFRSVVERVDVHPRGREVGVAEGVPTDMGTKAGADRGGSPRCRRGRHSTLG